jgi:2-iminobutanoate/2-iminopropanoate deaminase
MNEEYERDHPYSEAVVAGGLVFLSGCIPSETGTPMSADALLSAGMDVVERRLKLVGGGLEDVVKLTYFVTDMSLRDGANQQYLDLWDAPRPARTVIGVACLPRNSTLEIDVVARYRDSGSL